MAELTLPSGPAWSLRALLRELEIALFRPSPESAPVTLDELRAAVAIGWANLTPGERHELAAWASASRGALLRLAAALLMGTR